MVLLCNTSSHWLDVNQESALSLEETLDHSRSPDNESKIKTLNSAWPGKRVTCWNEISARIGEQIQQMKYCKISNIWCTKSQNLNDSRLVLQLPLPNPLKPGVKSRMKMWLEQRRQAMLQLHLSDQQFYCLLRCAYIRGMTVYLNPMPHNHWTAVSSAATIHVILLLLSCSCVWHSC